MITAYMLINAKQGKLKIVSSALNKLDEVDEVHETYGRTDIIAKVIVHNQDELRSFIQNRIQIMEGIRDTETLICLDDA